MGGRSTFKEFWLRGPCDPSQRLRDHCLKGGRRAQSTIGGGICEADGRGRGLEEEAGRRGKPRDALSAAGALQTLAAAPALVAAVGSGLCSSVIPVFAHSFE